MNFRRIAELKLDFPTIYENAAEAIHKFANILCEALNREPAIDGNEIQPVRESELSNPVIINLKEAYIRAIEQLDALILLPIDSPIKSSIEAPHGDVTRINNFTAQMVADLWAIGRSIQNLAESAEKKTVRHFYNMLIQKVRELDSHLRRRNENEGQTYLETIFEDAEQRRFNISNFEVN
jgi:hypothetical protein